MAERERCDEGHACDLGYDESGGERRGVRTHIAILHGRYLSLILEGRKRAECRLTRARIAPYGRVARGDVVYLKQSSGPFRARAIAERVVCRQLGSREAVRELQAAYEPDVLGGDEFWAAKSHARFATVVWLADVEPVDRGPRYEPSRMAWHVLETSRDGLSTTGNRQWHRS